MNHVHWWLFGLSFVMGLLLTLALAVRPVKRQVSVGEPANGSGAEAGIEPEPPTTKIPAAQESPTTEIPVEQEFEPTKIPVEQELETTKIPVEQESPATKIPVAEESTTTPAAKQSPKTRFSFIRRFLPKRAPAAKKSPKVKHAGVKKVPPKKARPALKGSQTKKIPGAVRVPPRKVPPGKGRPVKKAPVAKQSPAKMRGAKESPTKKIPVLPYEPYGPGSARATPDGGGPAGWLVKGRSDTRLYYTPDDPTYDPTVAQVWFKDEESAVRACFTPWRKSSRK